MARRVAPRTRPHPALPVGERLNAERPLRFGRFAGELEAHESDAEVVRKHWTLAIPRLAQELTITGTHRGELLGAAEARRHRLLEWAAARRAG